MMGEFGDLVLAARRACQQWEWSEALEAQGRAWELLGPLIATGGHDLQPMQIAYAELIDELAEAVQDVVPSDSAYPVEPELKAELCWQVSRALRERRQLPPPPPDWLGGAERLIVEEGFPCWRERADQGEEPHRRARELLERFTPLVVPAPGWVEQARIELSTDPASRAVAALVAELHATHPEGWSGLGLGLRPGAAAVEVQDERLVLQAFRWLDAGDSEGFRAAVTAFGAAVTACGQDPSPAVQPALEGVIDSLGSLAAEGRTLPPELLGRMPALAEIWQTLANDGGGPFAASPALSMPALEDHALLLDLAAVEARAIQALLWPETAREGGPGVEALVGAGLPLAEGSTTPEPGDLNAWQDGMLGTLTMAALWDEAAVWGSEPEAAWSALPVLQALAEGSGRGPAWGAEPRLEQLRVLLNGQEVVVVAPGARELQERLALERLRGVELPAERCGYSGSLALLVAELEMLHGARPIDWLVAGCGVLRLPLLLEMHLLHGIRGLALNPGSDVAALLQPPESR
jgi:hypothetical protein